MKKAKYYVITVMGILLFAAGLVFIQVFIEPQWIMRTLPYLCIGIGCGMFGHGLGGILSNKARDQNPILARQMDIDAKDERNVMHCNASKAKGFNMMTYVFAALMLSYVLMNASFKILFPFVIAYLFVQFYAWYYRVKIDSEQ